MTLSRPRERLLIAALVAIQFTNVVDFVIMMPLGPQLMRAFGGLLLAVVYAIVGDAVPYERRGAATGAVMAAFSLATVRGVARGAGRGAARLRSRTAVVAR